MKQMMLGIYLAVQAIFVLLLAFYEVLPVYVVYVAWASLLLALLSILCFLNGYTEKDNSSENKTETKK